MAGVEIRETKPYGLRIVAHDSPDSIRTVVSETVDDYTYLGSRGDTHQFELNEDRREDIRIRAKKSSMEYLKRRLCAPDRLEDSVDYFVVYRPGEYDVQAPLCEEKLPARTELFTEATIFQRVPSRH
jgi:hypothetical protein